MAWYTDGRHTNRRPAPPPRSQVLASQARYEQEFAEILADIGLPAWRVEHHWTNATRLWQLADKAWQQEQPAQLALPLEFAT